MKPVITIGICVRNGENMLRDAVDSIIKQDFPHEQMQIIFVDDGSEDNTLKVILNYASKIDIGNKVFHTKWRGIGAARHTVVSNADGDYILWVDADEILTKDYVRKQVEFMEKNPNVGITKGIVGLFPDNLILNLELIPDIIGHILFEKPPSFLWKTEKLVGTGAATFRVEALRQVNGFDQKFKGGGEDVDVIRRIKDNNWLIRLNDSVIYEKHGGMSTITDLWNMYFRRGHSLYGLYCNNRRVFSLARMSPPAAFASGFFYSLIAYKLLRQKKVFILPLHYGLKMTAWTLGFVKGQVTNIMSKK